MQNDNNTDKDVDYNEQIIIVIIFKILVIYER